MTIETTSGAAEGITAVAQNTKMIVLMANGLKDMIAMRTKEIGTQLKVDGAVSTAAAASMAAVSTAVAVSTPEGSGAVVNTAAAIRPDQQLTIGPALKTTIVVVRNATAPPVTWNADT